MVDNRSLAKLRIQLNENLVSSQNIVYHEVELSKWVLVLQVCDVMVEFLRSLPEILYNHAWGKNQISYKKQKHSQTRHIFTYKENKTQG